jgi:hypothetical protein
VHQHCAKGLRPIAKELFHQEREKGREKEREKGREKERERHLGK